MISALRRKNLRFGSTTCSESGYAPSCRSKALGCARRVSSPSGAPKGADRTGAIGRYRFRRWGGWKLVWLLIRRTDCENKTATSQRPAALPVGHGDGEARPLAVERIPFPLEVVVSRDLIGGVNGDDEYNYFIKRANARATISGFTCTSSICMPSLAQPSSPTVR